MPSTNGHSRQGVIYTETVVFSLPEQYAADAPYQLAIVEFASGERLTARILSGENGERATIGDPVVLVEERNGVAYFRRAMPQTVPDIAKTRGALA